MNKRLRLPMALAMALAGSHAYALGLGQIEVKSALNQPLVAEIPVLVSSPGEADALTVRLAAPDAFARVGLDRPTLQAANLMFEVVSNGAGRTVIRITTPNSVADPFLSFLLEVDWGKGKMLREYTVLLDPPSMMPITGSAPAMVAPVAEAEPMRSEPLLETPPPMPEPVPAPEPTPAPPAAAPVESAPPAVQLAPQPAQDGATAHAAGSYGPVNRGDTLWTIAQGTRPDASVTINQMMLALLRANPEAFIDNNINLLRKGAVLRIPGREEATTLAAAEAAAQVREQMQSWSGMTATTLQPAAGAGAAPAPARRGKAATADSRLELTPPRGAGAAGATTSGAAADATGRELRAELARTKEEVGALTQENVELKSRVGELEEIQAESRRLIELKDSELAAAQKRLREAAAQAEQARAQTEAAAAAQATAAAAQEVVPPEATTEPGTVPPEAPADATGATELAGPDTTPGADDTSTVATAEPTPAAAPTGVEEAAAAAAPSTPPASAEQGWFGFNPWLVGGGAAVLLGLVGLLLLARRTRTTAKVSGPAASALGTPAVAAFEPNQEEGELIEAISQHPDDLYLHLDLLRHYVATDDAVGFEMAAEAMYAQVRDDQDPSWQEAHALGQQIAPEHPLFASPAAPVEATAATALADTDEAAAVVRTGGNAAVTDEIEAVTEQRVHWDAPAAEVDAPEPDDGFDYTLDEPVADNDQPSFEPVADDVERDDFAHETFDAIDADAATTKLELARAYLDMGDAEGARGMLEEVLGEGTAAQRNEARQLLDGIA